MIFTRISLNSENFIEKELSAEVQGAHVGSNNALLYST